MVKSTLVSRVTDGMPLAASMDEEQTFPLAEYKQQAKQIMDRVSASYPNGERMCSVESGPYFFQ
jgi:vesicle transport protein SEC22